MPNITDAQVEVAEGAYWAVANNSGIVDDKEAYTAAMRAALEAYERVRDLQSIYAAYPTAEQRAENDACVEQALESLRHKIREGYQR